MNKPNDYIFAGSGFQIDIPNSNNKFKYKLDLTIDGKESVKQLVQTIAITITAIFLIYQLVQGFPIVDSVNQGIFKR